MDKFSQGEKTNTNQQNSKSNSGRIPFILTNTQFKRHRAFSIGISVFRWLIIILLAIYITITIYTYYSEKTSGDNMSMPFGFAFSVVISGSMEPTINIDDAIFVVKPKTLSVGDIIVFKYTVNNEEMLVVHRIRSIIHVGNDRVESNMDTTDNLKNYSNSSEGCLFNDDGETIKLVTQGDANPIPDNPINISKLKGKYVFKIDGFGKVIESMKGSTGIIAMVIIAIFLFLVTLLIDILLIKRNKKQLRKQIEILNELNQTFGGRKE